MGVGTSISLGLVLALLVGIFVGSAITNLPRPAPASPVMLLNETFDVSVFDPYTWTPAGARVDNLSEGPPSPPYALHLQRPGESVASRRIDLSGYYRGAIVLSWERGGTLQPPQPGNDLEISAALIGTARRIAGLPGGQATHTFQDVEIPLPPEAFHSEFSFTITNVGAADGGHWFVDDVRVVAHPGSGLDPWILMGWTALGLGLALLVLLGTRLTTQRASVAGPAQAHKAPQVSLQLSSQLEAFLRMNPQEGFDLEALNMKDLRALARDARRDKRFAHEVMEKVDALLPRLQSETEDPALAGAILRTKSLDWYRRSPLDRRWPEGMTLRWTGIFHESRVPGGRLVPSLVTRLEGLREECAKPGGLAARLLQGFVTGRWLRVLGGKLLRRGSKLLLHQPPLPRVAQAYLDDLAAGCRSGDQPFPLERVSDLARRIGLQEVNRTLAELFPREGGGPLVVLDARLHPDARAVMVRPPDPRAVGQGIAYVLVQAQVAAPSAPAAPGVASADATSASPWERRGITTEDWKDLLGTLRKQRGRLDPPPIDNYRNLEPYLRLRDLVLADASARNDFRSVLWKGRPAGLALVAKLLADGAFAPEAETDGDYLEAELGHIEKGNPNSRPTDGRWAIGDDVTVVREIAQGNARTYRVDRTGRAVRNVVASAS